MAMPQRLDHCPRDPGCTNHSVWRDPETHELYSLWTKEVVSSKRGPGPIKYHNEYKPHVCTNVVTNEIPTTFYMGEWFNPTTGRTRFIGPERLVRSALTPPQDKKRLWRLTKLRTVSDTAWKEMPIPEEFEHVVPRKEDS